MKGEVKIPLDELDELRKCQGDLKKIEQCLKTSENGRRTLLLYEPYEPIDVGSSRFRLPYGSIILTGDDAVRKIANEFEDLEAERGELLDSLKKYKKWHDDMRWWNRLFKKRIKEQYKDGGFTF